MLPNGRTPSFGGTCPACCRDLYLSAYSGGWSLRCIYCQLELSERSRPALRTHRATGWASESASGRMEVASANGV